MFTYHLASDRDKKTFQQRGVEGNTPKNEVIKGFISLSYRCVQK